jgi:hypothetical protein
MSMVARYYTSVACLDMQADNLMVLVTYGLSSAPSCLLSYSLHRKSLCRGASTHAKVIMSSQPHLRPSRRKPRHCHQSSHTTSTVDNVVGVGVVLMPVSLSVQVGISLLDGTTCLHLILLPCISATNGYSHNTAINSGDAFIMWTSSYFFAAGRFWRYWKCNNTITACGVKLVYSMLCASTCPSLRELSPSTCHYLSRVQSVLLGNRRFQAVAFSSTPITLNQSRSNSIRRLSCRSEQRVGVPLRRHRPS